MSVEIPPCWQDRELRFDLTTADLDCRKGEELLDTLVRTKGRC